MYGAQSEHALTFLGHFSIFLSDIYQLIFVHAGWFEQIKYLCKVWEFMFKLPTDLHT